MAYFYNILFSCSHFEDVDETFNESVNQSQIEIFIDEEFINPITGAPMINQDAVNNNDYIDPYEFLPSIIDDGEFLDTTADVSPNSFKHATCGKLSVKYDDEIILFCF